MSDQEQANEREEIITTLVKACKFALEYLEANEGEYGTEARIVACREAIAKAKGGVK